jgi:hypothetical protein
MRQCIAQVCSKENRGVKLKDSELSEKVVHFWKCTFCKIYPDLLDGRGLSVLKQLLAEQMLTSILVDTKTHFCSRFVKLIVHMNKEPEDGQNARKASREELRAAQRIASEAFAGRWENLAEALKKVLPPDVVKSVQYDLKRDPARYVSSTFKICEAIGDSCDFCFLPTRRSNIPCHCKLDTEAVSQIFIPHKARKELRKAAGDRKNYNKLVWSKILKMSSGQEIEKLQFQVSPRNVD